jgi:hypothetical protein
VYPIDFTLKSPDVMPDGFDCFDFSSSALCPSSGTHPVGSRWPLRRHSGAKPPGRAHQGNTDLGADAPAAAYHSFVRFMRIVSQLCSVQVSNEELGTGTVRVLHTLRPFAVAMAGAEEFDPWKD